MDADHTIVLPLRALKPGDVLADSVTVSGYTLYPENWELTARNLRTLEEWNISVGEVYADPSTTGINSGRSPARTSIA